MKERPIIFSTPMVKAILQGRKTMTRRIVKPQPSVKATEMIRTGQWQDNPWVARFQYNDPHDKYEVTDMYKCPYGKPGDRLWVRETFMDGPNYHNGMERYIYKASASNQFIEKWPKCWKPSIHMPRSASRILLEITNVRVERIQDITENDAKKEGVIPDKFTDHPKGVYHSAFMGLWESIYGKDSWNTNPWVWVIEFKKI